MGLWVWVAIGVAGVIAVTVPALKVRRDRRGRGLPGPIDPAIIDTPVPMPPSEEPAPAEDVHIRALGPIARARYQVQWSVVQRRMTEVPHVAVADADELITEVMHECGFPVEDFDSRAELVSLEHPHVVHNYRTAHRICEKTLDGNGSSEELQTAARAYDALFEQLVGARR